MWHWSQVQSIDSVAETVAKLIGWLYNKGGGAHVGGGGGGLTDDD